MRISDASYPLEVEVNLQCVFVIFMCTLARKLAHSHNVRASSNIDHARKFGIAKLLCDILNS